MGKKRDKEKEKELSSPNRKKLKKHKKQKKQKKRERLLSEEEIDVVNDEVSQDEGKGLRLKIKFAGKTLSEVVTTVHEPDVNVEEDDKSNVNELSINSNDITTEGEENRKAEVTKSEDEQWLDALEKGELDETGSVKKEKDITIMTTRQRALHGETIEGENELLQLPMYPEKTEEENEEFERKRKLRAKKRKQQIEKQIEETKIQTIEKLLTKSQKSKKETAKTNKNIGPYFRYTNNKNGVFISYATELDYPFVKSCITRNPPAAVMCSINGCNNIKKYACSITKLPVCSLQCYKSINK